MDQQLLVFATVAEKSNFSRAAEELHMTQPAVSQYIRTFEQQIGTRLMERTNKYVRLNKAGEIVYHHAKEILGLYSRMQYLVDDLMHKAEGRLSIGASYTFGEYVLPGIIAALEQRFPNIEATATIGNTEKIAGMLDWNNSCLSGIVNSVAYVKGSATTASSARITSDGDVCLTLRYKIIV